MTTTNPPGDALIEAEPLAVRDTLPISRRSRTTTGLTIGLLVAFGISAGFLVGVLIEKNQNNSTTSGADSFAALAQSFGAGGAGAGGAGAANAVPGGAGFGGGTSGQIKLIDGTNLYIVDAQGNTVKVSTSPSSTISTAQTTTLDALELGDTVVVRGTTGTDGTVSATSITATSNTASGTPTGGQ
ncbi:MAG: hypothetical protein WD271_17790 [Acidimicrobiia bacterium]